MWNTNMEDKTQGSAHYPGSDGICQLNLQKVAIPTKTAPHISVPLARYTRPSQGWSIADQQGTGRNRKWERRSKIRQSWTKQGASWHRRRRSMQITGSTWKYKRQRSTGQERCTPLRYFFLQEHINFLSTKVKQRLELARCHEGGLVK